MTQMIVVCVLVGALEFSVAASPISDVHGPHITFGTGTSAATLYARCPSAAGTTTAKYMAPTQISKYHPGDNVSITIHLYGCPATCANSPIDEPCADSEGAAVPLFFCNYNSSNGREHVGPFAAERHFEDLPEAQLETVRRQGGGVHITVTCPLLDYDTVERLTEAQGKLEATMSVQLSYVAPLSSLDARAIPFIGLRDGNLIRIRHLAPPPPAFPPSPPPAPFNCKSLKQQMPDKPSGVYDTRDSGTVYCDMDLDGGGWTLCANWVDDGTYRLRSGGTHKFWEASNHDGSFPQTLSYPAEAGEGAAIFGVQGTVSCNALASVIGATEYAYTCARDKSAAASDASAGPFSCGDASCSNLGSFGKPMSGTSTYVSQRGEYGWGGYTSGNMYAGTRGYPHCGGNSCNMNGWRVFTDGILMEISVGGTQIGGDGCAGGCQHDVVTQFGAGQQGVSCGGTNTQSSTTDRFSVLLR